MIYKQIAQLPIIFKIDENIVDKLGQIVDQKGLNFKRPLIVSGATYSREISERLMVALECDRFVIVDNKIISVDLLKSKLNVGFYDIIIAVGGGKVLDVVKRCSYLNNINHISIPTIISNDGLISPVSVLKDRHNKHISLPGLMPMGVLIDLDIILNSPLKFLHAAAGDLLSNISSTNDWIISQINRKEPINDLAFQMSRNSATSLMHFSKIDFTYKPFIKQIIQGQISSGIAMSLSGNSRPCSGSEHLISHAIDYLGFSENILHGSQVASITLFCLFLQGKLDENILDFARKSNVCLDFTSFIVECDTIKIDKIYNLAKVIRPNRYTVLNTINSAVEFSDKLVDFQKELNKLHD